MTSTQLPPVWHDRSALRDLAPAVVVTSPSAWRAATAVRLPIPTAAVVDRWDSAAIDAVGMDSVVAVGSGTTIDAAKLLARRAGATLTVVPTVMSTDAAFSTVAAQRAGGVVQYVETGAPELVVLDHSLLMETPWPAHLHGLGDLFAIESAIRDWQHRTPADGHGVRAAARALVTAALDVPPLWRTPSEQALVLLAELLHTKVGLGLLAGHPSAEEGTEHYLAYRLEPELTAPVWHGELLMACLPVCSAVQQWDADTRDRFRDFCAGLPGYQSKGSRLIPAHRVGAALVELPDYCDRHGLTNTVLASTRPEADLVDEAAQLWNEGW